MSNYFKVLSLAFFVATLQAQEPEWCDPKSFDRYLHYANPAERTYAFKIGQITLVGLPIGRLGVDPVVEYAQRFSRGARASEGYCTWYMNDSDPEAARTFLHSPLPAPASIVSWRLRDQFIAVLEEGVRHHPRGFISCLARRKYMALGCDQMKHRGPTAFAMILAFSGCKAGNASRIANSYWGLNWVPSWVRRGIVDEAYERGAELPRERARLQKLFRD